MDANKSSVDSAPAMKNRIVLILLAHIGISFSEGQQNQACPAMNHCLAVFTHTPAYLPKCYCTDTCPLQLGALVHTCTSGQLHADPHCGACLVCAKALGQDCGGRSNREGVCAAGLVCKVAIPKDARDKKTAEQNTIGRCVRDIDPDCASSTESDQQQRDKDALWRCRPGLLGIVAEALYCPDLERTSAQQGKPGRTPPSASSTSTPGSDALPKPPTLLEILGEKLLGKRN